VLSLLPFPTYRWTWSRLFADEHPMRQASDCLQALPQQRPDLVGRGLYVDAPGEAISHGMNYYFRRVRPWTRTPEPQPAALEAMLAEGSGARPMLVYDRTYQAFMRGGDREVRQRTTSPPMVSFPDVVLLLPGPWSACAGTTGTQSVHTH
jgi:hypothetical protein